MEDQMKLYIWTFAIDDHNNVEHIEGPSINWCPSLEEAIEQASKSMRQYLDSGVSAEDTGDAGIFSVEFDPTPQTIADLLTCGHIIQNRLYDGGTYATRMPISAATLWHERTIPIADMRPTSDDDTQVEFESYDEVDKVLDEERDDF
jgi:hypothetical protein